jgi:hypothetical protein
MLNFPQLQYDEVLKQKLYLFVSIFVFYFIGNLGMLFYQGHIVDVKKILKSSFQAGLLAVVGYSVFRDLENNDAGQGNSFILNLKASIVVVAFVAVGKVFDWMVINKNAEINDCLNLLYERKKT